MKSRMMSAFGLIVTLTVVGSAIAFWIVHLKGSAKDEPPKYTAPATQTTPVKESDLNIITLTPEAHDRLGIKVAPVAKEKVERARLFGGELMLPSGQSVTVSSPLAANIKSIAGGAITPGKAFKAGDNILTLQPLLTPEARTALTTSLVDAEGAMSGADVQLKAAQVVLARATKLADADAGSKKAVDEAKALVDTAQKTLDAATARRDVLEKAIKSTDSGAALALRIDAPQSGIVRSVFVAQGQLVSAGAPLVELVNHDVLWLRVPVYAGVLNEIADDRPAMIARLGALPGSEDVSVKPIAAPLSANAQSATRDLFFHVDNKTGTWAPGQRVGARLPLRSEEESLIVPWSAVVHDVNGGAWVYECLGPQSYVRRRVQVRHVDGPRAVLASGPAVGTNVVTQGVAELFGKEMGFGK